MWQPCSEWSTTTLFHLILAESFNCTLVSFPARVSCYRRARSGSMLARIYRPLELNSQLYHERASRGCHRLDEPHPTASLKRLPGVMWFPFCLQNAVVPVRVSPPQSQLHWASGGLSCSSRLPVCAGLLPCHEAWVPAHPISTSQVNLKHFSGLSDLCSCNDSLSSSSAPKYFLFIRQSVK